MERYNRATYASRILSEAYQVRTGPFPGLENFVPVLAFTTSASTCLQPSRNLGPALYCCMLAEVEAYDVIGNGL